MFDKTDLQRIFTASVGALILSTTCLLGAAGPVRAAEPKARAVVALWVAPMPLAS